MLIPGSAPSARVAGGGSNRQLLPVVFMPLKPQKGGDVPGRRSILEPPVGGLRVKWLLILIPWILQTWRMEMLCVISSLWAVTCKVADLLSEKEGEPEENDSSFTPSIRPAGEE